MTNVRVSPGICGLDTKISVHSEDGQNARVTIKTQCPDLKPLESELKEVDAFKACFGKLCDSSVYASAARYCAHPACPVPCAIIKGIEAACGFALPKNVEIRIE